MAEMKYKRVLLKLSGEALMGEQQYGIDNVRLMQYGHEIKSIAERGVEVAVVIGGGYGYPHHHRDVYRAHNAVPEPAPAEATSTKIFAYPNNGQNEQQQARDKFECYSWAVSESGFDPVAMATRGPSATPVTYTVRPNNPGPSDPLLGAAGGAALGAIGGAIAGDPGIGAAIGAAVGGTVGLANEVDESSRTKTVSTQSTTTTNPFASDDYRRAMSACLVARGYTVK